MPRGAGLLLGVEGSSLADFGSQLPSGYQVGHSQLGLVSSMLETACSFEFLP
jgi:hypothetical protein